MDAKDNRSAANPGETPEAWIARAQNGSWGLALVPEEKAWSWAESNPSIADTWPGRPEGGIGQAMPAQRQWLSSRTALFLLVGDDLRRLARTTEGQPVLGGEGRSLAVSLSHTPGMGAAATQGKTGLQRVGVDIECCSDRQARVLARISQEDEVRLVMEAAGLEMGAGLLWVIKEACYKGGLIESALFGKNQIITTLNKIAPTSSVPTDLVGIPQSQQVGFTLNECRPAWSGEVRQGLMPEEWMAFEAGWIDHGGRSWLWCVAYPR
jgi:hypothetical protein